MGGASQLNSIPDRSPDKREGLPGYDQQATGVEPQLLLQPMHSSSGNGPQTPTEKKIKEKLSYERRVY